MLKRILQLTFLLLLSFKVLAYEGIDITIGKTEISNFSNSTMEINTLALIPNDLFEVHPIFSGYVIDVSQNLIKNQNLIKIDDVYYYTMMIVAQMSGGLRLEMSNVSLQGQELKVLNESGEIIETYTDADLCGETEFHIGHYNSESLVLMIPYFKGISLSIDKVHYLFNQVDKKKAARHALEMNMHIL